MKFNQLKAVALSSIFIILNACSEDTTSDLTTSDAVTISVESSNFIASRISNTYNH
ncbi:hypothetical protein OEG92_10735 [Polaribacter sejongensis]|uniref:hypothetical protein n=1 Tax=Polaribacter sejongensis TaxID=985043 RepID=UPI0035A6EB00